MTKRCKHVWVIDFYLRRIYCFDCAEPMHQDDAEARLNATERLSAEDAREAARKLGYVYKESRDILRAYANTLEGK